MRIALVLLLSVFPSLFQTEGPGIAIHMQQRVVAGYAGPAIEKTVRQWNPRETAIIICDMWDQHWCKGATSRVAELAPRLNRVISVARQKGMLIVHAPSDCMAYYKDFPGRKLALRYDSKKYEAIISSDNLASEEGGVSPIDHTD